MSDLSAFNTVKKAYLKKLTLYVPIVARVHGPHHPEFYAVQKVFESLQEKIRQAGRAKPQLDDEFARLREITQNYTVPGDVCESYAAVYQMLAELDQAYQA